jgi:hypothetical protein
MRAMGLTNAGNVRVMVDRPAVVWGFLVRRMSPPGPWPGKTPERRLPAAAGRLLRSRCRVDHTADNRPVGGSARPQKSHPLDHGLAEARAGHLR